MGPQQPKFIFLGGCPFYQDIFHARESGGKICPDLAVRIKNSCAKRFLSADFQSDLRLVRLDPEEQVRGRTEEMKGSVSRKLSSKERLFMCGG